jgi:hypothetical protein
MAKQRGKRKQTRAQLDDPKEDRRSGDALVGMERLEAIRRIQNAQYRAQLDPKTRRPKR